MATELRVDDLNYLWNAGAVSLPKVAVQYSQAAIDLHKTGNDEAVFQTSDGISPLGGPWTLLRDTLQDKILVQSSRNLESAGTALTKIADAYSLTDDINAAGLAEYEDYKSDILTNTNPDKAPPPYVPDAPGSTDPHPEAYGDV